VNTADRKSPLVPDEYYREYYNKKVRHFIKTSPDITWNPVGFYSDLLWLRRISLPHCWPKGYWIKQPEKKYVSVQIILGGSMKVVFENQDCIVSAGDCIIIPPGENTLSTGPAGMCRKIYFIPSGRIFKNSMNDFNFNKLTVIHDFLCEEFNQLFDRVCQLHKEQEQSTIPELSALTFELILYTSAKILDMKYPPQLLRCMDYIGANISRKLSVESICAATGIGKTKIQELFRCYLHTSPGHYIVNLRLDSALKMLEDNSSSIKQIAYACGYKNPLYFSNAFKARFAVSPRNFLKNQLP